MVCGSPLDPEIVAPGQGRCRECGQGSSFTPLTARTSRTVEPAPQEVARAQDAISRRQAEQLERASFDSHGLDERWTGLRWIGGWGGSSGETTNLELAHGDHPFDPNEPQVRVATRQPANDRGRAFTWADLAQQHVNAMWEETGILSDDLRRAAFPLEFTGRDPTEPWDAADIAVDDAPVRFRVLAAGDRWYAQAHHSDVVLSITAGQWPIERTGLVSVLDVSEYITGTEEMGRRGRER
jgi:hypothetical protein